MHFSLSSRQLLMVLLHVRQMKIQSRVFWMRPMIEILLSRQETELSYSKFVGKKKWCLNLREDMDPNSLKAARCCSDVDLGRRWKKNRYFSACRIQLNLRLSPTRFVNSRTDLLKYEPCSSVSW